MRIDYIKRIVIPHTSKYNLKKLYLMIDCARCHKTDKVNSFCQKNGIEIFYIPRRLTNLLKPADVMWFSSIKKTYGERWNKWFIFDKKNFTPNGNLKSPGYVKVIDWMSEIWSEFDKNTIIQSFRKCGNMFLIMNLINKC